jgi:hypothetical protein
MQALEVRRVRLSDVLERPGDFVLIEKLGSKRFPFGPLSGRSAHFGKGFSAKAITQLRMRQELQLPTEDYSCAHPENKGDGKKYKIA